MSQIFTHKVNEINNNINIQNDPITDIEVQNAIQGMNINKASYGLKVVLIKLLKDNIYR